MSLKAHPMSLLRGDLAPRGIIMASPPWASHRNRRSRAGPPEPDTASGVIFITIEDATGVTHVICERLEDLTPLLGTLSDRDVASAAYAATLARDDGVRHPQPDPREPELELLWRSRNFK